MDLDSLCEYYYPLVYGYLLSITGGDADAAQDLAQETFLQAIRSVDRYRGEARVSTWLCAIAKNLYYKRLRRIAKYREVPMEEAALSAARETLETRLIHREDLRRIAEQLDKMDEPMAQVLRYRVFGDLSYSQIAELTGHTENWVRVMVFRARKRIEKELNADED